MTCLREKEKPVVDVTGRHGIGLAFAKPEEFVVAESKQKSKFYCDLCKVTTTSAEHLQMHISGQKHQKNLKKQGNAGLVTYPSDPFQELGKQNQFFHHIILDIFEVTFKRKIHFLIYLKT